METKLAKTDNRPPGSQRVSLSNEDRKHLAELAGVDVVAANADLDRLEIILADHHFMIDVFDRPKPNQVRDLISPRKGLGLQKRAAAMADALDAVPWQIIADFRSGGVDLLGLKGNLKLLAALSDQVLALYEGETTPRRPTQQVRDRHTIPAIAELFDRMGGVEPGAERDWERLDDICAFVTLALKRAGIPCPDAGDTRLGEEGQGRLRRLLKARKAAKARHSHAL